MDVLVLLLLLLAALCFLAGMLGWPVPRVNLVAAGLLCWVLSELIPKLVAL